MFALPAVNPTANAKNAAIAELERFIRKCDNYSAVSELLGVGSNSSPEQIVKTVTSVLEKLESSELSAEKDSLQSCIDELLDFAQDKSESDSTLDIGFAGYIERTVHSLKLLINTSKDDEKAIYAATHNSSISEDDPSNEVSESNDDSESEQVGDKVESNVFEKIIQFIFVGILLISLIGLPLFYYLDKRRKRIAKEYSGNNQKPDDSDKEDVGEVSEEPSNDDESSNEEKQEDNN